jgi:hypothetical protein
LTPKAIETLKLAMGADDAPWAAKVKAAETILDRGWAAQSKRNVNVSVFDQMTDDEQNAMLAALAALKAQDVGPLG